MMMYRNYEMTTFDISYAPRFYPAVIRTAVC